MRITHALLCMVIDQSAPGRVGRVVRRPSASVYGDPPAGLEPRRLGASLGYGARQTVEMFDGLAGDVAVGVR